MNEQEHHKKAFEFYYGMGEGRSYRQVAKEFGVSLGTVKMWGRTFCWRQRCRERDAEVVRTMADRNLEENMEGLARNRKIVKMGLIQVAKAVAEGKVRVTMADLDRLVRLEEYLREEGGPETAGGGRGSEGSLLEEVRRRFADREEEEGDS
jgi:transposase